MTDRTQPKPPQVGAGKKPFAHKALKTSMWSNDGALHIKTLKENTYLFSGRVMSPTAVVNLKVLGPNYKIPMEATDKMEAVVNRLRANLPRGITGTILPVDNTAPAQFEITLSKK